MASDILVVNNSRLITTDDILPAIAAINRQVSTDFGPAWNVGGTLYFGEAPEGAWQFSLQDSIDDAGDLGYHTLSDGRVSAIIDVEACREYGDDWRTCLGHEVLESLVDPLCTRMGTGDFAAFMCEVADPVEADFYMIDGIPVTNFIHPAYLGWDGARYDQMQKLTGPAPALSAGGYIEELVNGQWRSHRGDRRGYMASRADGRRAWRKREG